MLLKHKIMRCLLAAILTLAMAAAGMSQDARMVASSQNVVASGERFRVSFTVNADASSFTGPDFKGLSVLSGPNKSTSSSVQIINGSVSHEQNTTFSYIVAAGQPGTVQIGAAKCIAGGKEIVSNSLTIEVVQQSGQRQQAQPNQGRQQQAQQQQTAEISDKDIFVTVQLDKREAYISEPIVATLKIYTKLGLANFKDYKFPTFRGFFSQAIEEPQQISMVRENLGGEIYEAGLFRQVLLYPQHSGDIIIEPFELEAIVRVQVPRQSFFDPGFREASRKLASKPITVKVKDLPKPSPASFSGAVGNFSLSVKTDKTELPANEAFTLTATISGTGNFRLIDKIAAEFPEGLEVYDPKISNNLSNTVAGSKGSKTFEYLVIPRHAGQYDIPAVQFSFFDTKEKRYKTVSSKPITINAGKGAESQAGTALVHGLRQEKLRYLGSDIRYIKLNGYNTKDDGSIFFGSAAYYGILLLPMLAFALFVAAWRQKIADARDTVKAKNRKAGKISKKRLKHAQAFMKSGDNKNFYEELARAIWGYLSDKLGIPLSELSKESARQALEAKKVSGATINMAAEIIDVCEFARYAPSATGQSAAELLSKAGELISKIEKECV
jgi:hypothetical protein